MSARPEPFKPLFDRARIDKRYLYIRAPERWIDGLQQCVQIGNEAVANHCPACRGWRVCWLMPDGAARCFACDWQGSHSDFVW